VTASSSSLQFGKLEGADLYVDAAGIEWFFLLADFSFQGFTMKEVWRW